MWLLLIATDLQQLVSKEKKSMDSSVNGQSVVVVYLCHLGQTMRYFFVVESLLIHCIADGDGDSDGDGGGARVGG